MLLVHSLARKVPLGLFSLELLTYGLAALLQLAVCELLGLG
jgi:hypothetical protein